VVNFATNPSQSLVLEDGFVVVHKLCLCAVDSEQGTGWTCPTVQVRELPSIRSNRQNWWTEERRGRYHTDFLYVVLIVIATTIMLLSSWHCTAIMRVQPVHYS